MHALDKLFGKKQEVASTISAETHKQSGSDNQKETVKATKESGIFILKNEDLLEEFAQEIGLSQDEKNEIQKQLITKIKQNKRLEIVCARPGYDLFISIAIDKKPFEASWKKIPTGTGWKYMKEKPDSYIDKIDDYTYYAIATSKGLESVAFTIPKMFGQSLKRIVSGRIQLKKDLWLIVFIDVGYFKLKILQGDETTNFNDLDKRLLDKIEISIYITAGDGRDAMVSRNPEELGAIRSIISDKMSKIIKILGEDFPNNHKIKE